MPAPLPSLVAHVLELLEPLGPARARPMFGGWIFHLGGLAVGLIADERLYLKADRETRSAFAEAGGEPFTFAKAGKLVETSYWTPPEAALEDPEAMAPWAEKALAAARRAKSTPGRRRGRATATAKPPRRSKRPKSGSRSGS